LWLWSRSIKPRAAVGNNRTGLGSDWALAGDFGVTRITLLALFFVSIVGFTLERAQINLVLMSASALAILLWSRLWKP
jgi:hypothetical protein